jgi:hypothetical protein
MGAVILERASGYNISQLEILTLGLTEHKLDGLPVVFDIKK